MTVASVRTDLERLVTYAQDVVHAITTERATASSGEAHESAKAAQQAV